MGTDLLDAYRDVRSRICAIAIDLSPAELATIVPSCPEWTVHDLIAHNMALPAAIGAGDLPDGDLQAWLDGLVEKRRGQPVAELVAEWQTLDEVVAGVLSATPVLLDDLATHEHDLRAAVGPARPRRPRRRSRRARGAAHPARRPHRGRRRRRS